MVKKCVGDILKNNPKTTHAFFLGDAEVIPKCPQNHPQFIRRYPKIIPEGTKNDPRMTVE